MSKRLLWRWCADAGAAVAAWGCVCEAACLPLAELIDAELTCFVRLVGWWRDSGVSRSTIVSLCGGGVVVGVTGEDDELVEDKDAFGDELGG